MHYFPLLSWSSNQEGRKRSWKHTNEEEWGYFCAAILRSWILGSFFTSLMLAALGVALANPGCFVPPSVVKEVEIGGGRPYERVRY